ncbi:MAG: amino-acid N-acetyltransferase [Proteobacteria bacterium]|nr:amino-acid N-acetyltransferase [Pseudomonadota bacterium]
MEVPTNKHLVEWFRTAAPYIRMHKNKTFVFAFDGSLVNSPNFMSFIHDLNILTSIGIKIVLVHGSLKEIRSLSKKKQISSHFVRDHQIIDKTMLSIAQEVSGKIRLELEAKLSTTLPNSPMEGSNIRVSSGNFIFARPVGVIDGVDTLYAGETRKIDVEAISDKLQNEEIVLLSPMGFSSTGEMFLLNKEDIAVNAAISLRADKLIFLTEPLHFEDRHFQQIREMYAEHVKTIIDSGTLSTNLAPILESAVKACNSGVDRVHVVNEGDSDALITELFTHKGMGILVTKSSTESVRRATPSDIDIILELIKPLQETQILTIRTREEVELAILDFIVLEHDKTVVGCAALHNFVEEKIGELACLAVHKSYRDAGGGTKLLKKIEKICKENKVPEIFALTTQSSHWFIQHGFSEKKLSQLPRKRLAMYNNGRNSKTLSKKIL